MPPAYPKTDILLAYKEVMTQANAGAVSKVVANLWKYSACREALTVFGVPITDAPLDNVNFQPLPIRMSWLYGKNRGFLKAYLAHLKNHPERTPELVEIHSRCLLAKEMKIARPDLAVSLYMHNDARMMRGGKTAGERVWLIENLDAILFVSDYLKQGFIKDLPVDRLAADISSKCHVIGNELTRVAKKRPFKKKTIILAGRMVPEKGILEACQAAARILPNFPDWHLHIVGGRHFQKSALSAYEQSVQDALLPIRNQSTQHGFMKGADLAILQAEASIALVPSLWDDPAPLAVLEALLHGCALLTTDKGGIPETATSRAEIAAIRYLDIAVDTDREKIIDIFAQKLQELLVHPERVRQLQDKAWHDFPFDARNMAVNADKYRLCVKS